MNLENLEEVRDLMEKELDFDVEGKNVYKSAFIIQEDMEKYILLLREEIKKGDPISFSEKVKSLLTIPTNIRGHSRSHDAHLTLGEGEFNRFYMRAVCTKAIEEDKKVIIYRARSSSEPRLESESKIDMQLDPKILLEDLRNNYGRSTEARIALPNSGLSIKIVK